MTFILNSTSDNQPETSEPSGAAQNEPPTNAFLIRPFEASDAQAVWGILQPMIRAGETYALPRNLSRGASLSYWLAKGNEVFVAESDSVVVGTYFLKANQRGGGSHVANCGYATAPSFFGHGMATSMCADSLERARRRGFEAMQFNFVVSTNTRAIAIWKRNGFAVVGCIPHAFLHPVMGLTDVYVMYRAL